MFKFCGSLFSDLLNKTLRSLPAWILWFRGSGRVAKAVRPGQDSRPSFTSSTWCRRNISKTMFSSFLQVLSVQSPRKVDHIKILLEMRELLSQLIVTKIYPKKRGRPVWPCYYSLERSVVERSVAASCFRDERRETWPSPLAGGAMCPLCGWASWRTPACTACAHFQGRSEFVGAFWWFAGWHRVAFLLLLVLFFLFTTSYPTT